MKKQTRDIWRPDMPLRCWTSDIGSGGIFWHSAARRIIVRRIASWIDATEKLVRGMRRETVEMRGPEYEISLLLNPRSS